MVWWHFARRRRFLCYNSRKYFQLTVYCLVNWRQEGESDMYINDLGIGRAVSDHSVKVGSAMRRKNTERYADYATTMKKAVERQGGRRLRWIQHTPRWTTSLSGKPLRRWRPIRHGRRRSSIKWKSTIPETVLREVCEMANGLWRDRTFCRITWCRTWSEGLVSGIRYRHFTGTVCLETGRCRMCLQEPANTRLTMCGKFTWKQKTKSKGNHAARSVRPPGSLIAFNWWNVCLAKYLFMGRF